MSGASSPAGNLFPSASPNTQYDTIGSPRVRKLWGPMQSGTSPASQISTTPRPLKPSPPPGGSMKPSPPSGGAGSAGRPSPHSRYGLTPRLDATGSLLPQPHLPHFPSPGHRTASSTNSQGGGGGTPRSHHSGRPPPSSARMGGGSSGAGGGLFGADEPRYPFSWVRQMHAIVLQSAVDLSFGKALERVAEAGKALTNCKHCQVFFLERVGSHNSGSAGGGNVMLRLKGVGMQDKLFPCEGLAGICAVENAPILCNRPHHDARFNPEIDWAPGSGVKTCAQVPMTTLAGKVVGVVQACNKVQGGFSQEDIQALDMLARQAAVTFDLCIQSEARQAQFRKVNVMLKGMIKLAAMASPAELAHRAGLLVKEVTGASQANCFMLEDGDNSHLCSWSKRTDAKADVYYERPVPIKGFLEEVLRDARNQRIHLTKGEKTETSAKQHLGSLYAPVMSKDSQPAGVIQVRGKKNGQFTEVDESLASLLAKMVGTLYTNFSRGNTVAMSDNGKPWVSPADAEEHITRMMTAAVNAHTVGVLFYEESTRVFWTTQKDRTVGGGVLPDSHPKSVKYLRFSADAFPLSFVGDHKTMLQYPPVNPGAFSEQEVMALKSLGRKFLHEDLHLESLLITPLVCNGSCVGAVLLINQHNRSGPFEAHSIKTANALASQWGKRLQSTLHETKMEAEIKKFDLSVAHVPALIAGLTPSQRREPPDGMGATMPAADGPAAATAAAAAATHGTSGRLPDVLAGICVYLGEILKADRCWAFVIDKKKHHHHHHTKLWASLDPKRGLVKVEAKNCGHINRCMAEDVPLRIDEAMEDPEYNPWLQRELQYEVQSAMCVPLTEVAADGERGRVVGAIQVMNKKGEINRFSPQDQSQLEMLVPLILRLVENAENIEELLRLQEGVRVAFDQRDAILDQTAHLHLGMGIPMADPMKPTIAKSRHAEGGLLTRVRRLARSLIMAGECNVFVAGHNKSIMYELTDDLGAPVFYEPTTGIVGHVMTTGATVHWDVQSQGPTSKLFDPSVDQRNVVSAHSSLCVPLLGNNDDVLGSIQVLNSLASDGLFSSEDGRFLLRIGKHIGAAMQNGLATFKLMNGVNRMDQLGLCEGASAQIRHISESLQTTLTAERVNIFRRDGDYAMAAHDEVSGVRITIPIGQGYVGRCAQSKAAIVISDVFKDKQFVPAIDGRSAIDLSHALFVPVFDSEGEVAMVVEALNKSSGHFDDSDEQMIRIMCTILHGSLRKDAHLDKHDEARRDAMGLLTASSYLFPLVSDPDGMINTAIGQLGHLCEAKVRIFLAIRSGDEVQDDVWRCYEDGGNINVVAITGIPGDCYRKAASVLIKSIDVSESEGKDKALEDGGGSAEADAATDETAHTTSFLCQPLMDQVLRCPVGVIEMRRVPEPGGDIKPWQDTEAELVQSMASLMVQSMVHHAKLIAAGDPMLAFSNRPLG